MQPPVNNKFAQYGGPNYSVDTEMKGTVVGLSGNEMYVAPFPKYHYVILEGNRRHPVEGEDGWCFFRDYILPHIGEPVPPIMKLETYGVGARPASAPPDAGPPWVNDNGERRQVRQGDNIKVSGLYVIDYDHPPYWPTQTDSYTYMRGLYKAAFAHAEIHPYNHSSVELLPQTPGPEQFSEIHTVGAPVYTQSYSQTYFANKVGGVAGDLIEDSKHSRWGARVIIPAPPRPAGPRWEPKIQASEEVKAGSGTAAYHSAWVPGEGMQVAISAEGSDVYNPIVYRARYTVQWVEVFRVSARSQPNPPPLDKPVEVRINTVDAVTGERVGGTVSISNPGDSRVHTFNTNTPFTLTFRRRPAPPPLRWIYPVGQVRAPGYETALIDFGWRKYQRDSGPEQGFVGEVDIETLRHIHEQRDAELAIRLYAADAELRIIDRDFVPSSPKLLRGSGEIAEYLRARYRQEMIRYVENVVVGEDRIALNVTSEYPDGTKALTAESYELRDGKIIRQMNVEIRDEHYAATRDSVRAEEA